MLGALSTNAEKRMSNMNRMFKKRLGWSLSGENERLLAGLMVNIMESMLNFQVEFLLSTLQAGGLKDASSELFEKWSMSFIKESEKSAEDIVVGTLAELGIVNLDS